MVSQKCDNGIRQEMNCHRRMNGNDPNKTVCGLLGVMGKSDSIRVCIMKIFVCREHAVSRFIVPLYDRDSYLVY